MIKFDDSLLNMERKGHPDLYCQWCDGELKFIGLVEDLFYLTCLNCQGYYYIQKENLESLKNG